MHLIQLVQVSTTSPLTAGDIWQHFTDVIAPEIGKRQVVQGNQETRSLGQLLDSFSQTAPTHEVNH